MIVFVAPYSPVGRSGNIHLGAARKIEAIISILSQLDQEIILINTAHNETLSSPVKVVDTVVSGVNLIEIIPPTSGNRTIGKLKNIFDINCIIKTIQQYGRPQCVWVYNGYAFEMLFVKKLIKTCNIPVIFEFEDWHFSRNRGLNPKPYLDYMLWKLVASSITHTFAVNNFLYQKMQGYSGTVSLLPGIVPKPLVKIASQSPPFMNNKIIKIGYFGGLTHEKGAGIILQLVDLLPSGFQLIVTGAGELEELFNIKHKTNSDALTFYGRVDEDKLYALIAECDILLNPHASIDSMNNGVFPFKVVEAIASGRLLISTSLPDAGFENILSSVKFVDHSLESFLDAILTSAETFFNCKYLINQNAVLVDNLYGEEAFKQLVQVFLNGNKRNRDL